MDPGTELQLAIRQCFEPRRKLHDHFIAYRFKRPVENRAVDFAPARIKHAALNGAVPNHATAFRFDTVMSGFDAASAKPLAAARPTRTPVKEPGPAGRRVAIDVERVPVVAREQSRKQVEENVAETSVECMGISSTTRPSSMSARLPNSEVASSEIMRGINV
jgi:hypothetical protein